MKALRHLMTVIVAAFIFSSHYRIAGASESARTEHWAFAPLHKAEPAGPGLHGSKHPIDRFIGEKLRVEKLEPVKVASRAALLRRVYYDLIGLPPTPEELDRFMNDSSGEAWSKVIERLLASPQYGERWGRHWMDVVRYADTAGDNADYPIPEAYRYRDYIIAAFNADKPYDQFAREQLAGDLLAKRGTRERYSEQLVATGFLALSRRYATGPYELWHLTLENTIETTSQAFLGLNLRCARCHDHKYDPLTTQDYYGLYGIFESTEFPWPGAEELHSKAMPRQKFVPLAPETEVETKIRIWRERVSELRAQVETLEKQKGKDKETEQKFARLKTELRNLERRGLPADVPAAYAVHDGNARDTHVQLRGEPEKQGPLAPRRAPQCLAGEAPLAIPAGSGRLEFADWLASTNNPLFARVIVNRIWQHHFGKGLVGTPNNFGRRGDPPTHPQLLDYLAVCFIESGWSIKTVHRLILSSVAYQLSSNDHEADQQKDPANLYCWRFDRRRLEAEAIRDSMLFASGALDLQPAGEHPFPPAEKWSWTQHNPFKDIYATRHRSVYLMTPRFQRHPFLALFDGPDTNTSTEARRASIVPQQALYSLNNPFVDEQAHLLARRILARSANEPERVRYGCQTAWSREPSALDLEKISRFLNSARSLAASNNLPNPEQEAWTSFARVLLTANEFLYVD
jgi:hypothetical protein